MVQYHVAFLPAVEHRVLEEGLGLQVLSHQMQDPAEGIQVGGVVRFGLHGLLGHRIGLLQFLPQQGKVVGVVVQHRGIIRVQLQGFVIGLEGAFLVSLGVLGIPHHRPGAHAQVLLFRVIGQDPLAVADDGVVVLQLVVGHIGVIQEGQLPEVVEGRHGTVPHLLPMLLQGQVLDVGGRERHAFRMGVGRLPEPSARLFLAAGGIVVASRGR